MSATSNTILNNQYDAPGFTGAVNVLIGPRNFSDPGVGPGTSNLLQVTGDATGAIIVGDFANRNIAFGMTGLTGPSYGTAQNVVFLPITSSGPSSAIPGGIGLFTDGANLQFINTTGAIGNIPPIQIFKTCMSGAPTFSIANNVYVSLTGTFPWQTGTTGFTNTTAGTFQSGAYTFGSDANNSLWIFMAGLKYSTNGTNSRWVSAAINGSSATNNVDFLSTQAQSAGSHIINTQSIIPANSGDFISILAFQNSGSALTISGSTGSVTGAFGYGGSYFELIRVK